MRLFNALLLSFLLAAPLCFGQQTDETDEPSAEELAMIEEYERDSICGQSGVINFDSDHFILTVPEGFVYLNPAKTRHLLVDYWGNPPETVEHLLGSLVSSSDSIYIVIETAYAISYAGDGYVSDSDAEDIDYDDLLETMRKDLKEEYESNPEGKKWEILGWGWQPEYDKVRKTLSWSKHYLVDDSREVINYDVRILGREGYVEIKAIASPDDKDLLLANNSAIVSSVAFDNGYRYEDFDPDTDHIAEWTIGGLIAGKVLAKAGVWAVIAKFGKVIIVALLALFAAMRKRIAALFGRRAKSSDNQSGNQSENN